MGSCDAMPQNCGADYVILNLGTNDNSGFKNHDDGKGSDGAAGQTVITGAKQFLGLIRKYNPEAKIIWTWGMISLDIIPALIQKGIEEYKKESGDKNVYTLELESMEVLEKSDEDKGSRGHPGPLTHKKASERIFDFISSLQNL